MFIRHRRALLIHASYKLPARSLTRLVKTPRFGMTQQESFRHAKEPTILRLHYDQPPALSRSPGITGNLPHRVFQHKNKLVPGFTCRYNLTRLVYYEEFVYPDAATNREKEIKAWRRGKKIRLIESMNPSWNDLAEKWGNIYETSRTAWATYRGAAGIISPVRL